MKFKKAVVWGQNKKKFLLPAYILPFGSGILSSFQTEMVMSQFRRSANRPKPFLLQKPNGVLADRVQAVGPEHFGIVAFDCAKARSRYLFADFYGHVFLEPTTVAHNRHDFNAAIQSVRQAMAQHGVRDCVV